MDLLAVATDEAITWGDILIVLAVVALVLIILVLLRR